MTKKKTVKVTLPGSITEATERLEGIESLLTSTGWERAAIVYAFTEDAQGRRTDLSRKGEKLSMADFAELNINGLKKPDTVAKYRALWAEHGDTTIKPGDTVTLPDLDFPPTRTGTDGYETDEGLAGTIRKAVVKHGGAKVAKTVLTTVTTDDIATAADESEDTADVLADVVASTGKLMTKTYEKYDEKHPKSPKSDPPLTKSGAMVAMIDMDDAVDSVIAVLPRLREHAASGGFTDVDNLDDVLDEWANKLSAVVDVLRTRPFAESHDDALARLLDGGI